MEQIERIKYHEETLDETRKLLNELEVLLDRYIANGGSSAPANQTGNGNITLSTVKPTRNGYTFKGWAKSASATSAQYQPGANYNLTANTILYAVWQKNETPGTPDSSVNPTADVVINVRESASVSYRTRVTVTATAYNVPSGYYLAIYEGNTRLATGNNHSVSYNAGEMTESKTFSVRVIDGSGRIQKDGSNNDLNRNCMVSVNTSFIARIIAVFRGLFGKLPETEIKP